MTPSSRTRLRRHLQERIRVTRALLEDPFVDLTEAIASAIVRAYRGSHKVLLFGNGGSAGDAQHLAGEFVGRYRLERRPLPALALAANSSSVTAVGNDYGFDRVFARQVEALGVAGDVAIGISTSGRSRNVVAALEVAKAKGLVTVGLTGQDGGLVAGLANHCLCVPSHDTPTVQEAHMAVGHIVCELVEAALAEGTDHGLHERAAAGARA